MRSHYHVINIQLKHIEAAMTHLVTESTLTDRYQTTVPDLVRKALDLKKREKLRYTIEDDGRVMLSRAEDNETDPVMDSFLDFIASDIQSHPERVAAVSNDFVNRVQQAVKGVEVDLNAPLDDEDDE
jgi:antitoxin PrlF